MNEPSRQQPRRARSASAPQQQSSSKPPGPGRTSPDGSPARPGAAPAPGAVSGPGASAPGASACGSPAASAEERPARLTVGVVGAGRVGPALAAALRLAGHRPVAVSGVSDASRRRAAELLPGVPVMEPAHVLARAELVLLTVPDDALEGLVAGLASTGAVRPGQLLVHTSGRYGVGVLDPALRAGALPLALHPAMTFTGTRVDVARLAGCSFGVTAPGQLRLAAEALVVEMGGEPEWIEEEARPLYHAALAIGANHLVTLVAQSLELLGTAGVAEPGRMLGPLLGAALDNALRSGDAALTGPVARGDARTVAAHVGELRRASPQALASYVAMARATADRALANGMLKPGLAEDLLDVLADGAERGTAPPARPPAARGAARGGALLTRTKAELEEARALFGGPSAVVMTMGALHEGHAALIRAARERAGDEGLVMVTVFVNPLQFGPGEDLDRYPRTLDADRVLAAQAGADIVFAPSVGEVYGGGEPRVRISAGAMGGRLEGAYRPGHFDGMLTVVAKLLHLTRPDTAFYGQKDAQQLALIRRMAADLSFGTEIAAVPTVREPDGLALSSRNRFLSPDERTTALVLSRALSAGRNALAGGPVAVREAARAVLDSAARAVPADGGPAEGQTAPDTTSGAAGTDGTGRTDGTGGAAGTGPGLVVDYLALVGPSDFTEVPDDHTGDAVLAVAARIGPTRLIDNIPLDFGRNDA